MLIKMVDGKLVYDDIQSSERTMEERCRIWESREQASNEMKEKLQLSVNETRKTINALKKERAHKEAMIERNQNRYKALESRWKLAEERNANAINDTRLDQLAKEKERKIKMEIGKLYENQRRFHMKIMDGLLKTEVLEKQLHNAYDKDMRLKERKRNHMDDLRYSVNRQDELKLSIRKKLTNIKEMHAEFFSLEPKMKESLSRVQAMAVAVTDLKEKVKNVEDQIKKSQDGRVKMVKEMEKQAVKHGQKQKRSMKGPERIAKLEEFSPKRTPIECYKIKKPEIIKAFEKFTQLYAVAPAAGLPAPAPAAVY